MSDPSMPPRPSPDGPPPAWDRPSGDPPSGGPPPGGPPPGGPPSGDPPPGSGQSRRPLLVGLVVVAVVVAGAAYLLTRDDGGPDVGDVPPMPELSAEEREYVDAFSGRLQRNRVDDDQADCVGVALVDVIDIDALQDAAPADEFRDSEGDSIAEISTDLELGMGGVEALSQRFMQCGNLVELGMALVDGVVPDQVMECLRENLTEEVYARYFAANYAGDYESRRATEDDFNQVFDGCADEFEAG